jgi:hypothetical protein
MTKTEKYHYRFGPSFEDRFTLSRNGTDVLKEENEDKELKVQSIDDTCQHSFFSVKKSLNAVAGRSSVNQHKNVENSGNSKEDEHSRLQSAIF